MLIGITAPNTKTVQILITIICEQLCLQHINMRQPLYNAIAALLEVEPHEVTQESDPRRHYERWGLNHGELEFSLSSELTCNNKLCFIDYAEKRMHNCEKRNKPNLFNGFLIAGIASETEADWLRKKGGTLIHIYDYNHPLHDYVGEYDEDYVMNAETAGTREIANLIASLEDKKPAAA